MIDPKILSGLGGGLQGASTGYAIGGPIGAGIGGIVGGAAGLLGGGDDEAKQLMKDQIKALRATAREQKRRSLLEVRQTMGKARVASYAGNIQQSGTTAHYQRALESEMRHRIAWDDQRVRMEEEILRQGGRMASSQIQMQGFGQLLSGIGAVGKTMAGAGVFSPGPTQSQIDNNWNSYSMGGEYWR